MSAEPSEKSQAGDTAGTVANPRKRKGKKTDLGVPSSSSSSFFVFQRRGSDGGNPRNSACRWKGAAGSESEVLGQKGRSCCRYIRMARGKGEKGEKQTDSNKTQIRRPLPTDSATQVVVVAMVELSAFLLPAQHHLLLLPSSSSFFFFFFFFFASAE
jgi:hypothetical protein